MEKKYYDAPAIDIVRVHTESSLAAGTGTIGLDDKNGAWEEASSKKSDSFDDDDTEAAW